MCASPVHRLLVVTIAGSAKTLGSIRISYLNVRSRELLSFPARTTFWRGTGSPLRELRRKSARLGSIHLYCLQQSCLQCDAGHSESLCVSLDSNLLRRWTRRRSTDRRSPLPVLLHKYSGVGNFPYYSELTGFIEVPVVSFIKW